VTVGVSLAQLQILLQVLLRVAALALAFPFFDSRAVPRLFKVGLLLGLTLAVFPLAAPLVPPLAGDGLSVALGVLREVLLGAAVGLLVRSAFAGIMLAGQLAGYQMGLAIANVLDPQTSAQVPLVAQLFNLMAMLLFLTLDAHHLFIRGLVESFRLVPPLGAVLDGSLFDHLVRLSGGLFVVALQVGAPVVVALLLVSVALGLVARAVPQMNVFIVAMPLQILVGLAFIGLGLPELGAFLRILFAELASHLIALLRLAG
jgi:flagellar biosynthetic protein FliR